MSICAPGLIGCDSCQHCGDPIAAPAAVLFRAHVSMTGGFTIPADGVMVYNGTFPDSVDPSKSAHAYAAPLFAEFTGDAPKFINQTIATLLVWENGASSMFEAFGRDFHPGNGLRSGLPFDSSVPLCTFRYTQANVFTPGIVRLVAAATLPDRRWDDVFRQAGVRISALAIWQEPQPVW